MKPLMALALSSLSLVSFSSSVAAVECNFYSRQPSIDACVRTSLTSPRAKREGYSEAGIRRWCEQNQPICAKKKS
jgi:hypothetical protein